MIRTRNGETLNQTLPRPQEIERKRENVNSMSSSFYLVTDDDDDDDSSRAQCWYKLKSSRHDRSNPGICCVFRSRRKLQEAPAAFCWPSRRRRD